MELKRRNDVKIVGFEADGAFYKAKYYADNKPLSSLVRQQGSNCYVSNGTRYERWRYDFNSADIAKYKEFRSAEKAVLPAQEKIEKKKEQYTKDLQEQKKELLKEIEDIAENYQESPEKLAELAAFQSRFYNYSFRNMLLIYSQNRGASFVGSFVKLKELGQQLAAEHNQFDANGKLVYFGVKAGQKGMKILVPVETTLICTDKAADTWVQLSKATAEQKAAAKAGKLETKKAHRYKLGTVFDIGQTNIPTEYYPQIYSMGYSSEQHAKIFEGLKSYIENELNCPVEINIDNSISLRGRCYTAGRVGIELNDKLEDTQKLSTLTHELGHFLMHRGDVNKPADQCEVEADIYNIMLNAHFGIETNDVRRSHLATSYQNYTAISQRDDKQFDSLEKIFANANKAYRETVDSIDKYVQLYTDQNKVQETEIIEEEIVFEP